MAKQSTEFPVQSLRGSVQKGGAINRIKTYRDSSGRIIAYGPQELYKPQSRNYRKHPPTQGELLNQQLMSQANCQAKEELADPVKREQWQHRFDEQLLHATPDSPILPDGNRKVYKVLRPFVFAVIFAQLKATYSLTSNQANG